MKKNEICSKILILLLALTFAFTSCKAKKQAVIPDLPEIQSTQKNHTWYYFNEEGFEQTTGPQNTPQVLEKPWTEAVRIASAASCPAQNQESDMGYALVNHMGLLVFAEDGIELKKDLSIFSGITADSIVFTGDKPVFYLYRSSFFNKNMENSIVKEVQPSRPFLVEFDTKSNAFFPLVTYQNLNLGEEADITDFFWDGKTWACTAKRILRDRVEFSYFYWTPEIPLTEISPALSAFGKDTFRPSSEDEYRNLNIPKFFNKAPEKLQSLLSAIPKEFTFSISWRDTSGTSPITYFQQGTNSSILKAYGAEFPGSGCTVAVFSDGTTYLDSPDKKIAFRLPLLPAGYVYGGFAMSGDSLYVAWEQTSFYKTGRSGFIKVNVREVMNMVN